MRDFLPYRVRIGVASGPIPGDVIAAARAALRERLPKAILELLASPTPLGPPARTPVRYQVLHRDLNDGERLLATALAEAEEARLEPVTDPVLDHLAQRVDLVIRPSAPPKNTADDPLVILARRRNQPIVTLVPFAVEPGRGLNRAAYQRLDQFNGAEVSPRAVEREIVAAWRDVFESEEGRRLPVADGNDRLLPVWARADLLAQRYQSAYRRAGQAVWVLFPIAVAAVAVGTLYPPAGVVAFPAQAALLILMLLVVWRADRGRSLERWVEHRLLAERLRVAVFMRAAGFEAGSFEPPPHLGRHGRSEWIATAFSEIHARLPAAASRPAPDPAAVRGFLARHWIGPQRAFHARRAEHQLRQSRRLEHGGHLVFLLAILVALGHSLFSLGWVHAQSLEQSLLFFGLVLPGVGAAMGGFRAHREFSRIAKRSTAMAGALASLEQHLLTGEPEAQLEEHLRQVEQVVIGEVQDWVVLMRVATVQPVG